MLVDKIWYILHLNWQLEIVFLLATIDDKSSRFLLFYQAMRSNMPKSIT